MTAKSELEVCRVVLVILRVEGDQKGLKVSLWITSNSIGRLAPSVSQTHRTDEVSALKLAESDAEDIVLNTMCSGAAVLRQMYASWKPSACCRTSTPCQRLTLRRPASIRGLQYDLPTSILGSMGNQTQMSSYLEFNRANIEMKPCIHGVEPWDSQRASVAPGQPLD